jgi:hypothetical protein
MPWQETDPLTARLPFMATSLSPVSSMTEQCERFGSRCHTGDQWVRRNIAPGLAGLQEQSRAPHRCPHRLSEAVAAVLLATMRAHRHWGPPKILPAHARRRPALDLPAPSTAGALCPRAGLSHARTRRRGHRPPGASPLQAEGPHAVWTADCKGQCRPGAGCYCSPLTVAEASRRWLCSGAARLATTQVAARPSFARRCQDYGLPDAIRTDTGAPFATPACCDLRQLSGGDYAWQPPAAP